MSDYPMLISNKLHSFRNFCLQKYEIILIIEYNSLYLHYKITSKNETE